MELWVGPSANNMLDYNATIFSTGGTLGLFTGMSILSMVEAAFWAAKTIVKALTRLGKKNG